MPFFLNKTRLVILLIAIVFTGSVFQSDKHGYEYREVPQDSYTQSEPIFQDENEQCDILRESEITTIGERTYTVTHVVDGDTIRVLMNGVEETVRLIGIDTPETVHPEEPVECFGKEASAYATSLMRDAEVVLEADPSQSDRDKYGRLLRFVFLSDGTHVNLRLIEGGYAHEYTYNLPYRYQKIFRDAEREARYAGRGLWGEICANVSKATDVTLPAAQSYIGESAPSQSGSTGGSCLIKGNINDKDDRIYHVPGCGSYAKTVIREENGERWFCTEDEARSAGWRKAKNC